LRQLGAGPGVRAGNWLWCLGILYSTVATLQHVFLDVVAGAALGAVVAVLFLRSFCADQPEADGQPASCPGAGTTQR
jgi:hypothetical protein